jgi:hypothetical protein
MTTSTAATAGRGATMKNEPSEDELAAVERDQLARRIETFKRRLRASMLRNRGAIPMKRLLRSFNLARVAA